MTILYSFGRLSASVLALLTGFNGWPIAVLALAIALQAAAGFLTARAQFGALKAQIEASARDAATAAGYIRFYEPALMREVALAFVKCGILFALGFGLSQFAAVPAPPDTASSISAFA